MSSLAERALGWKAAAPAPSAGGEKRKAAQPSGAAKVSPDSSSSRSSRSRNRSSNLNSSPSSSSSRRRPRGWGSQPSVANFSRMVGGGRGGGVDVEAPTRGTAAPGEAVFRQSGLCQPAEPTAEGGGSQNELVPCSQTQRAPWDLVRCTQARVSFAGPVPR